MSIKRATITDLDAVAGLFDLYRLFYLQESNFEGAKAFLKERIMKEESVIFLANDHENHAVGFVQLYPIFSSVSMKRSWVLNDLYVDESARKKGFAEKLIKAAVQYAEETGAKGISLETGKENSNAQKLYEKIGFIQETNYFYYYYI